MHYHLIGIGGSSMAGIAHVLTNSGNTVSGTDERTTGHGAEKIPANTETVIYSEAVTPGSAGFAELESARSRGLPTLRRIEFIEQQMANHTGIAIAGAHGKSTTTALIGWCLVAANQDPTVFIGADLTAFGGSARSGLGDYVVSEACEWNRQFLVLHPTILVITSVDREHLDTYPGGIEDVEAAFMQAAAHVRPNGFVVANADDSRVRETLRETTQRIIWIGTANDATYQITNAAMVDGGLAFNLREPNGTEQSYTTPLVGQHHAMNAAACVAVLRELGIEASVIQHGLASFPGLKRRFERYRSDSELVIIDDYAHHPAEVAATIQGARAAYPNRRLIAVFQPHLSQRTTDLFAEFVDALAQADQVVLLTTYEPAGRAHVVNAKTSHDLAIALTDLDTPVLEATDNDSAVKALGQLLRKGDVCLVMGATSVWRVAAALADNTMIVKD